MSAGAGREAGGRAPLPPLLAAAASRPFVGRLEERELLERGWEAADAGQRSVAVVAGEPGIGKTAIAAAFARDVHLAGGTVLYGACEAQSVVPYHPVVMALREHLRHERLPWSAGDWLAEVAAVLGLTPGPRSAAGRAASASADGERHWLFEGVRRILELLAERRPTLLVLDDLHWAEPSTLMMIGHLAREADPSRLIVLAAYRDTDVESGGALHDVWSSPRVRPVDHVALGALQREDTAELLDVRAGGAVARHVADRWHERTGGHPFFLDQLLRRADPGTITRGPALDVPEGVRDLISRRVGRLAEASRVTLRAAAVVGAEFDLEVVSMLTGLSDEVCLAAVEEAIRGGLVVELPDGADRFAFVHALVRESLYEQQTRSRRNRLHARVVGALERTGAPAAELAHHAFAARHVLGYEPAVEHSRQAALGAAVALAYEDAVEHYRRALVALEAAPAGADHQRCEVLLGLGEAQARAGQAAVDATFAEAVRSARRRADADQLGRAALAGRQSETGVRDDTRIALLSEALVALGDRRTTLRVEVLARLASVLHFAGEEERARTVSAEALELAGELGDPRALIPALHGRHGALMHIADVDERLDLLARLTLLAEGSGHSDFVALAREWSIYALLELGRLDQARREYERFETVAAVLRQPRFDHAVLAWRTVFAQLDGRLDEAERPALEGRRFADRVQVADADSLFASQLCFIRRDQDRLRELLPVVGGNASSAADLSWQAGLVIALAGAGERRRALAVLQAAGRHAFEDVPRDFWWLSRIALFAEGCALVGEERLAAPLYRLLEPYADRHVQLVFAAHLGSVHRFLGLLSDTRGDSPRAIEHFEAACQRHQAGGAPALVHRSACDLAGALMRAGRGGDRRRAESLLARAVADAAGTSLEPLISRLAREAAGARRAAAAPRSFTAPGPAPASRRRRPASAPRG